MTHAISLLSIPLIDTVFSKLVS